MRTLLLLRHGKAVGSDPSGDHARALADRGHAQVAEVATLLRRLGLDPELALASDARRTRETAEGTLAGTAARLQLVSSLYAASAKTIIDTVRRQADEVRRVLVVGHNPGLGEAARLLEGTGEPQAVIGLQQSFPTAALAVFEFDLASWAELTPGSGHLARFVVPEG